MGKRGKRMSVNLTEELNDELDRYAELYGCMKSAIIHGSIQRLLVADLLEVRKAIFELDLKFGRKTNKVALGLSQPEGLLDRMHVFMHKHSIEKCDLIRYACLFGMLQMDQHIWCPPKRSELGRVLNIQLRAVDQKKLDSYCRTHKIPVVQFVRDAVNNRLATIVK